jgi:hypothetical protein
MRYQWNPDMLAIFSNPNGRRVVMPSAPSKSFLLRLWREQQDAPLRATLIDVAKADTPRHFPTLTECFDWLHEHAAKPDPVLPTVPGSAGIVAQKHALEK